MVTWQSFSLILLILASSGMMKTWFVAFLRRAVFLGSICIWHSSVHWYIAIRYIFSALPYIASCLASFQNWTRFKPGPILWRIQLVKTGPKLAQFFLGQKRASKLVLFWSTSPLDQNRISLTLKVGHDQSWPSFVQFPNIFICFTSWPISLWKQIYSHFKLTIWSVLFSSLGCKCKCFS